MKILIDMNLSPLWREPLVQAGHEVKHWFEVGNPSAPDTEIMEWARKEKFIVLTHDLDYGALLHATNAERPSVIQMREQDVTPRNMAQPLLKAIEEAEAEIQKGALVTIYVARHRVSILPLRASK